MPAAALPAHAGALGRGLREQLRRRGRRGGRSHRAHLAALPGRLRACLRAALDLHLPGAREPPGEARASRPAAHPGVDVPDASIERAVSPAAGDLVARRHDAIAERVDHALVADGTRLDAVARPALAADTLAVDA